MPEIQRTMLPTWSFKAAKFLAEERKAHFKNRFPNKKLREIHSGEKYLDHVESIVGYLGDIAASIYLNIDPTITLREMIDTTNGLSHRDDSDVKFRNHNIDVKIEDYGYKHNYIIENNVRFDEPYGCRLINEEQWSENKSSTDIYLFGSFDPQLSKLNKIHNAREIAWIGYATSKEIEECESGIQTPAKTILNTIARMIPNDKLNPADKLKIIPMGTRNHKNFERIEFLKNKINMISRI